MVVFQCITYIIPKIIIFYAVCEGIFAFKRELVVSCVTYPLNK